MKIRTKLIAVILCASLPPLIVTGLLSIKSRDSLKNSIAEKSLDHAQLAALRINERLYSKYENVKSWANNEVMSEILTGDKDRKISSFLSDRRKSYSDYYFIVCADKKGAVVSSSDPRAMGMDLSETDEFREALKGAPHIQDPKFNTLANGPALAFSYPIHHPIDKAKIIGAMVSYLKWETINDMNIALQISGKEQDTSNHIMITANDGTVISCFDPKEIFTDNLIKLGMKSAQLAREGKEGFTYETSEHKLRSFSTYSYFKKYKDMPNLGWIIVFLQDPAEAFRSISSLQTLIVIMLIFTAIFSLLVAILFAGKISKPILMLSYAAEAIGKGQLRGNIIVESNDELGALARSFNQMSQDVEGSKSALKDVAAKLLSEKNKLESVIAAMNNIGLTIHDREFKIIYQNRFLANTFGGLGDKCYRVYEGRSEVCEGCPVTLSFKDGKSHMVIRKIIMPSGEIGIWENTSSPICDADGNVVSCLEIGQNITERVKAENEKENLQKNLAQSEKMAAVGLMAAGIAHEINNPISTILGFAQSLSARIKPGDVFETGTKTIEREATRCMSIIKTLLAFSRTSPQDRSLTDMNSMVSDAVRLLDAQAKIMSVEIRKELSEGLPGILVNPQQIQQVIVNLGNNAFDAMGAEGGTLAIKTELLAEGTQPLVCLKVSDTGSGIPPEIISKIFTPFFTTKGEGKGTGLGLSLVHDMVEKNSGTIEVQSRPGCTEFTIKFKCPSEGLA